MDYFAQVTLLASLAVVVVQQILKLNVIPVSFANRFPVPTNIVLSAIAAVVVTWQTALQLTTVLSWLVYVGTVSVVAAITYNNTVRNWTGLREKEGEGK